MRPARSHPILALLLLGTMLGGSGRGAEPDKPGLGRALAGRLTTRRLLPRTHATDFAGTELGCIVLPRRELRPYGYPGHAFLCEDAQSGEVLGAVLNRRGARLCTISGVYVGDLCYDFDICGYAERLCVVE
jgi:hypothetical protein